MVTVSRLDNGNVLVHVDCVLKSGAVRQYFVTPDAKGGAAEGVDDVPFVQILGRAQRWKTLLATGAYKSKSALARALGVDKANLTAVLRLPYLSPVIVEKVLSSDYKFTEKPETRRFFMDLQQTFIDWNDKPTSSPEFASLKDSLLSKISSAAN